MDFQKELTWPTISLFSFAKFLELLCYSPAIYQLTPEICEHTCPPAPAPGSPSHLNSDPTNITQLKWRLDILRHFAYQSHTVSVKLSAVEDIFELRVPKLQIVRTGGSLDGGSEKPTESHSKPGEDGKADDEKKALRREIKEWWQGVAEHMDKLVSLLLPSDHIPWIHINLHSLCSRKQISIRIAQSRSRNRSRGYLPWTMRMRI